MQGIDALDDEWFDVLGPMQPEMVSLLRAIPVIGSHGNAKSITREQECKGVLHACCFAVTATTGPGYFRLGTSGQYFVRETST
jgi:hypothetical protein